jgi:hypothetical protein
MLHTREEVSKMYNGDETILAKYDEAVNLAAKKKIRIKDGSTPISTITIKVDYSDSAGANNCALMEQMNDVQLALGRNYMTPAQIFNTDSSEELHTSLMVLPVHCSARTTASDRRKVRGRYASRKRLLPQQG